MPKQFLPYSVGASVTPPFVALRSEHGWKAEAWFWYLAGELWSAPDHRLELTDWLLERYSALFNATPRTVANAISGMRSAGLMCLDGWVLTCPLVDEHARAVRQRTDQARRAGIASAERRSKQPKTGNDRSASVEQPLNRKRFVPPTLDQCLHYGASISMPRIECEKFHSYWESAGWKRKGQSMASWEASMRTWKLNLKGSESAGPAPSLFVRPKESGVTAKEAGLA